MLNRETYSTRELAELLKRPIKAILRMATREKWEFIPRAKRGGGCLWLLASMPSSTRDMINHAIIKTVDPKNDNVKSKISEWIPIKAAIPLGTGFFLDVPYRDEDFWLFLGNSVGWGRFSKRTGCIISTIFELIEIRPPYCPEPTPVVFLLNLLWGQQEYAEAKKYDPISLEVLRLFEPRR